MEVVLDDMKTIRSIKTLALASVMGLGMLAPVYAEEETPLDKEMSVISSSLKKLRKAETTEDKVALMHTAQEAAIKALKYLPRIFKDITDEAEKAKATADYKKMSGQVYVKLCELEMAYLAEDEEKVDEIKDQIKDLKKEGHQKYTD